MTTQCHTVRQSIFAVVVRADPSRLGDLKEHLAGIRQTLSHGSSHPFGTLETLHFFSFTIFCDKQDNFDPYLVFESNIDGSPDDYIDALCNVAAPTLHTIYCSCADYGSPNVDAAFLRHYLRGHIVWPAASFVGNVGHSARRIREEALFVAEIERFLDGLDTSMDPSPDRIVSAVRDHFRGNEEWSWVWQAPPCLSIGDLAFRWAPIVVLAAAIVALLPLSLLLLAAFVIVLRAQEKADAIDIPGPRAEDVREMTAREDQDVQNHMASLCYVKAGEFRRRTLKAVLFFANLFARVSIRGTLMGLNSLHFAHWSLIDDDKRLLFLTNYDGSWENYLDDFIDKAACGLTAIWSNTCNFPRTSFLILGGARDERNFKAIARTTQYLANVWYSAYPNLTVPTIENNAAICEGLAQPSKTFDAAAWFRRL